MNKNLKNLEEELAKLKDLSIKISEVLSSRSNSGLTEYEALEFGRTISQISSHHFSLMVNLEFALMKVAEQKYPLDFKDFILQSFLSSKSKPGYFSSGEVPEAILDFSVNMRIIKPEEKEKLLKKRAWEKSSFKYEELVEDLEDIIELLGELIQRLKGFLSERK